MKRAIFLLAVAIATAPALLRAQKPDNVPPPKPPFVRPPPSQSAWTIKVTRAAQTEDSQDAQPAKKQRVVVAIASTRYGESKRDVVNYSDGSKVEYWFVGGYGFWPYPGSSRVGVSASDLEDMTTNEPATSPGFPGLYWLSAESYQGVAKIGDVTCRHYLKGGEGDSWEAWIGLESGLPVAAKFGSVGHTYAFTTPPAVPLQMPAAYAQALEAVKKQAARAAALAEKFRKQ